jgi:hypothetical protein
MVSKNGTLSGGLCGNYNEAIISAHGGSLQVEAASNNGFAPAVWPLLENAQFRAVVAASGRLGYLKHPLIGVKRLQRVIRTFVSRKETKKMLSLASTAAEFAGAGTTATTAENLLVELVGSHPSTFRPPFLSLGPAELGIYRAVLADSHSEATPPQGTIMVFEHSRASKVGHSWLNAGEENKLERGSTRPKDLQKKVLEARAAQKRFLE